MSPPLLTSLSPGASGRSLYPTGALADRTKSSVGQRGRLAREVRASLTSTAAVITATAILTYATATSVIVALKYATNTTAVATATTAVANNYRDNIRETAVASTAVAVAPEETGPTALVTASATVENTATAETFRKSSTSAAEGIPTVMSIDNR